MTLHQPLQDTAVIQEATNAMNFHMHRIYLTQTAALCQIRMMFMMLLKQTIFLRIIFRREMTLTITHQMMRLQLML